MQNKITNSKCFQAFHRNFPHKFTIQTFPTADCQSKKTSASRCNRKELKIVEAEDCEVDKIPVQDRRDGHFHHETWWFWMKPSSLFGNLRKFPCEEFEATWGNVDLIMKQQVFFFFFWRKNGASFWASFWNVSVKRIPNVIRSGKHWPCDRRLHSPVGFHRVAPGAGSKLQAGKIWQIWDDLHHGLTMIHHAEYIYISMYICICIYVYVCVYVYICIYT